MLPAFDSRPPSCGPYPFRVLSNATTEFLEFTPIGAAVPNRGAEVLDSDTLRGQNDIYIFGLRYLQQISDRNSGEPLHLEPGFWLQVPETDIPKAKKTIVRQGSIPHGNAIIAQGSSFPSPTGKPVFPVIDTTPSPVPHLPGYLEPLLQALPPPPFTNERIINNPNLVLEDDIQPFFADIKSTEVFDVSSETAGGVLNIPFLENSENNNAAVTKFSATYWIQNVVPKSGKPYQILQYSQTIILRFLDIDWPHVTVATLHLQ